MVQLQGRRGERFGGTFLDDLSLRRACRATGESVLEEFLCFGVVAALILARLQGHWGQRLGGVFLDGFWQGRSCITIMPQGRRSWPQDGSNAAVRPFFRACVAMVQLQGRRAERFEGTFLDDFSLCRACRATGESVLE